MRLPLTFALLILAGPASAQYASPQSTASVRVTARIVVVERESFTRAGLDYVVLGNDRVRVSTTGRRRSGGARVQVGTQGVTAFLEAVRASRWIRSESTQQVLTMSGSEAVVFSNDLSFDRRTARTRGPALTVIPTVLDDGRVHLQVFARIEDELTVSSRYRTYRVDGSPAAVDSEVVIPAGEEVILASSSAVQTSRESGILRWGGGEEGREVLIVLSAQVVSR